MELRIILQQIDSVLEKYEKLRSRSHYEDCSGLSNNEIFELITLMDATIDRLAPPKSRYRENANSILKQYSVSNPCNIKYLLGILKALRTDYESGYLESIHELVHAEVFLDFIEMAEYLFEEGYKDPAAVLMGSLLEENLRKLCQKHDILIDDNEKPKKADRLNSDLANNDIYSKLDQKSITAWLDLRNKAAHGKYSEYTKEQVGLMIQGIKDFLTRFPA